MDNDNAADSSLPGHSRTDDDLLAEALQGMSMAVTRHNRHRSITYVPVVPSTSSSLAMATFHHAQVEQRKFRTGTTFTLTRGKHRADELSEFVCQQLHIGFGPGHVDLLREWKTWYNQLHYYLASYKQTDELPPNKFMETGVDIISTLFLLGGLHRCEFIWVPRLVEDKNAYGCCAGPRKYDRDWAHISMDPGDHHIARRCTSYAASILGTLLHECIHALLRIYPCRYVNNSSRCRNSYCVSLNGRSIGRTGHGSAFLQIASHVEVLTEQVLGEKIDLGLLRAHDQELTTGNRVMCMDDISAYHPGFQRTVIEFVQEQLSAARQTSKRPREPEHKVETEKTEK